MKQLCLTITYLIVGISISFAQTSSTTYEAEAFGSVSSGTHTPFWMVSHNWGMVPLDANNGYVRGETNYKQTIGKKYEWETGLDVAISTPHAFNTFWIQQLYSSISWKKWRLRIGSRQEYTSFLDENLSSGDFVLSNNARPIPEINIELTDFTPVPFTQNKLFIRGDFAVGKLFDGNYVEKIAKPAGQDYYRNLMNSHSSLYFRVGNFERKNKFRVTFGIQQYAYFNGQGIIDGKENYARSSFSDFLRTIFLAKEGGPNGPGIYKYKSGSHFGAYTVKLDYKPNSDTYSLYWHHYIEDGSSAGPQSARDMLLGFQYQSSRKQLISGTALEYIYTKNQSGSVHFNEAMDEIHKYLASKGTGMDDYYDNAQYVQGPSYYGRSFGTPLFLSPEYNTDGTVNFKSNRIIAFHGAMEGYFSNNLSYLFRATYGETWGRYKVPYTSVKEGLASSLDITYHFPKANGLDFKWIMAFNSGGFFDDTTFGTGISIIKHGLITH